MTTSVIQQKRLPKDHFGNIKGDFLVSQKWLEKPLDPTNLDSSLRHRTGLFFRDEHHQGTTLVIGMDSLWYHKGEQVPTTLQGCFLCQLWRTRPSTLVCGFFGSTPPIERAVANAGNIFRSCLSRRRRATACGAPWRRRSGDTGASAGRDTGASAGDSEASTDGAASHRCLGVTYMYIYIYFGAFCLDVRTLTFCQLMGFPLNH